MLPLRLRLLALPALLLCSAPLAAQEPTAAPMSLPALVVTGARTTCPNREDPQARSLWEAMRARYTGPALNASLSTRSRHFSGRVRAEEVGSPRLLPQDSGWRGTSGAERQRLSTQIARSGYAVPYGQSSDLTGRFERWVYPPLEAELSTHFIAPVFGERNTLSLIPRSGGGSILGFCPKPEYRKQPAIEGRLILNADTTLAEAQWSFRTPKPVEEAGGQVLFLPPTERDGSILLLPQRGTYFIRKGLRYFEVVDEFLEWQLDGI